MKSVKILNIMDLFNFYGIVVVLMIMVIDTNGEKFLFHLLLLNHLHNFYFQVIRILKIMIVITFADRNQVVYY